MNNFFQHVVAITIAEQERAFAGIVVIDWLIKLLDYDFKFYLLIKYDIEYQRLEQVLTNWFSFS